MPSKRSFDLAYCGLLVLLASTSIWLLGLPVSRFEQQSLLDRFHLQTPSFSWWCLQQPIPAMYNGYNRYESRPGSESEPQRAGTVNHFPVRLLTFGDNRDRFLSKEEPTVFDAWTSYRGLTLHTRWTATPDETGYRLVDEVAQ